jgi:predicted unusual protein kinase regulating ubiquinone biosynthesis (AarF/ABC1/UbiB family)
MNREEADPVDASDPSDPTEAARALLERLGQAEGKAVPRGALRRLAKTARAAARTGASVFSGRLRGRGDGLSGADLRAIEKLVTSFGELKGVAMKMGQILSYIDDTMPREMRALLALLQTQSQPTAWPALVATVEEDLGDRAEALLAGLDRRPVSVASIGQVHRGRLPDGTEVAVKVLHPGIRQALRSDFRAAGVGSSFARVLVPAGGGTAKGFIAEAKARLEEECDYALEAVRQETFGRLFKNHDTIVIPAVHGDWSTDRVLTTTWLEGRSYEAFLASDPDQATRDRVGRALFEFYFGTLYRHALFHADPHPGNYTFREDGRVGIFDFGCVREFDAATVGALANLLVAVREDDAEAIGSGLVELGARRPKKDRDLATVRGLLRGFFAPMLTPGEHRVEAGVAMEARSVLSSKRAMLRLRLPGKLLFLFRIRFGLYAVLARLGARCDWRALETALAGRAAP